MKLRFVPIRSLPRFAVNGETAPSANQFGLSQSCPLQFGVHVSTTVVWAVCTAVTLDDSQPPQGGMTYFVVVELAFAVVVGVGWVVAVVVVLEFVVEVACVVTG